MNKRLILLTAGLLIGVCFLMAACVEPSKKDKGTSETNQVQQEITTTPVDKETESTKPTVEGSTQVGSGRGEVTGDRPEETTPAGTEPVEPTEPTAPTTTPTTPSTPESVPDNALNMNYKQYMALSSAEQQAFYNQYFSEDPLAFATWFQKIKQAYDDETPEIIATGPVDIGDYLKP